MNRIASGRANSRWPRFTNTPPSPLPTPNGTPSRTSTTPRTPAASSVPSTSTTAPLQGHGAGGPVTISARQFRQLIDQQKALQESNERVLRLLEAQQEHRTQSQASNRKIPKDLSVS